MVTLWGERMEKGRIESQLKGNTLRVYLYALKKDRVGVREVQRALALSNPSLAQYHLNKLREMGLLIEEQGDYRVSNEIKVDVMKDFLRFGTFLVPRFVFYAVFFTVFAIYLGNAALQSYQSMPISIWFTALLALASVIFWYEAQKAWRSAPSP
jgi:predicted DNA-binding transcriptional regulator